MKEKISREQRLNSFRSYAGAVLLCLLLLTWVLKLWHADLRVPLTYGGDVMFYSMVIKGTLDNGWFLDNNLLGLPTGLNLRDVPTSDNNFYFLLIKLFSLFSSDHALIINLFFLLTFPLTTLSSLYVLRQFKISYFPALFGSLLYTFIPYHLNRGQHHLFLSAYYLVPLVIMVILWICSGAFLLNARDKSWPTVNLRNPKLIFSLIVCLLVASTGTYYAYFTCFFLLVAGAVVTIRRLDFRHLLIPGILIIVIFTGVVANLSPSIIYMRKYGDTPVVRRSAPDSDIFGLRIAQLLLPVSGHRLPLFVRLKMAYNLRPYINENDDVSLGIIGSTGFLILLGWIFYQMSKASHLNKDSADRLLNHLSLLNVSAVLLGTIGGFGSLVALIISPKIRAYNRIGIYIAFFSLFAVILFLEQFYQNNIKPKNLQVVFGVSLAFILIIGVLDQTSERVIPDYDKVKAEYHNDADFVSQLEASVTEGAMIFQLPIMVFPESPKINKMNDYDPAKGYLHSKKLRWSYGAIKGRENEIWQRLVAAKPTNEFVETIAAAGFSGIYVDRNGYADNGAKVEAELSGVLGAKPLTSGNSRLVFFNLTEYNKNLREKYTSEEWEAKREEALHPLLQVWHNGCSDLEGTDENYWRWCSSVGELQVINDSRQARRVIFEASFAAQKEANLQIDSPFFNEQLRISPAGKLFSKEIVIPPGKHTFKFASDAPRILDPRDFRHLVFRVNNFKLKTAP